MVSQPQNLALKFIILVVISAVSVNTKDLSESSKLAESNPLDVEPQFQIDFFMDLHDYSDLSFLQLLTKAIFVNSEESLSSGKDFECAYLLNMLKPQVPSYYLSIDYDLSSFYEFKSCEQSDSLLIGFISFNPLSINSKTVIESEILITLNQKFSLKNSFLRIQKINPCIHGSFSIKALKCIENKRFLSITDDFDAYVNMTDGDVPNAINLFYSAAVSDGEFYNHMIQSLLNFNLTGIQSSLYNSIQNAIQSLMGIEFLN